MPLDAEVLIELMLTKFSEAMEGQPDVLKSTSATTIPLEDGSTEVEVTEEYGPPEIDPETVRPLMTAIANAVIDHFTEEALVDDQGNPAPPAGEWGIQ